MPRRSEAVATAAASSKREAILTAALGAFLESGYASASMDAIAARAGVSKATIYAHFNSKDELFGALIAHRCDACFGKLAAPDPDAARLRDGLVRIGRDFFDMVTQPEAMGMFRVVVAEAPRSPEIAQAFYEAGPRPGLDAMARYFAELARRGVLDLPDARLAAEFFVGMLRSDSYVRLLLGMEPLRARDELVEKAVDVILRAYAPASK